MTTEGKVSPLPWSAVATLAPIQLTFNRLFWQIGDANSDGVAFAFGAEREGVPTDANAAFIVRAVNAHDRLVAALEGLKPIFEAAESAASGNPEWEWVSKRVNAAKAALAAAKEGK